MKSSWKFTAQTILLSLAIGGLAGVASSAFTNTYLSDYAFKLGDFTTPLRLSEERPRAFPSSYADALRRVQEGALSSAVAFYAPNEEGSVRSEAQASGVTLTSDGWILSFGEEAAQANQRIAFQGGSSFVTQRSVTDPVTGVVFAQIPASNLSVLAFGDAYALQTGEQVFILQDGTSLIPAVIVDTDVRDAVVMSSDVPSRRLSLSVTLAPSVLGAPVVNLSGELVGLISAVSEGRAEAIPLAAVLPAFSSLVTSGAVERPSLGVESIDLFRTLGLSEEYTRGFTDGARVTRVIPGGAAAKAGVRVGDIIRSFQGKTFLERSLDERLLEVKTGALVPLVIDRAGTSITTDVTIE